MLSTAVEYIFIHDNTSFTYKNMTHITEEKTNVQ